jgi:hypothetical protein
MNHGVHKSGPLSFLTILSMNACVDGWVGLLELTPRLSRRFRQEQLIDVQGYL